MRPFSARKFFWGLAILVVGGLVWAENLGLIEMSFRFSRDWPVLLVAAGLLFVWDSVSGRGRGGKSAKAAGKPAEASEILAALERGEIDAREAARRMGRG